MKVCVLAVCATLLAANAALAEDCTPTPRAVFTRQGSNGMLTVPVTIAGKTYPFAVEFASTYSSVSPRVIDELHLTRRDIPSAVTLHVGGMTVKDRVTLPDIGVAGLNGKNFEMLEIPGPTNGAIAGFLGMDLLNNFDVELDLKANTMRLFSPDQCPGQAVYWTKDYGQIAIDKNPDGSIFLDGVLDGKKTKVIFTVEYNGSVMGFSDARDLIGFAKNDPKLVPVGDAKDESAREYRYPFATLALGDLAIKNPQIVLYPQTSDQQCKVAPDGLLLPEPEAFARYYGEVCLSGKSLSLGRDILRQVRLYFALKEGVLYLTPASAGATDAKPAAGAAH